jgi:hypothetical protein
MADKLIFMSKVLIALPMHGAAPILLSQVNDLAALGFKH